jgi:hypothetical protein
MHKVILKQGQNWKFHDHNSLTMGSNKFSKCEKLSTNFG